MVVNIAHMGGSSLGPENTLAAAGRGLEAGADWWETDVSITRDGELILFHDASLARTTNAPAQFPNRAPWTVSDFSLAEIRSLDAGSWFVESDPFGQIEAGAITAAQQRAYRGQKVPTLREGLIFTQAQGWRINLELKHLPPPPKHFPLIERVLALLDETKIDPQQVAISSFNHDWLHQILAQRPAIEVQALIGYSTDPLDWGQLEFKTYNARYTLVDEDLIQTLREKGIAVNLWTLIEEKDMRRFIITGVAGLITDFPQTLAGLLS